MKGDPLQTSDSTALEDDRELWEVLARSPRTGAGPYFTRRVLREAALLPQGASSSALWRGLKAWWQAGLPLLRPPRAAAWPGALVAVVICTLTLMTTLPYHGENLNVASSPENWGGPHSQPITTGPVVAAPGQEAVEADAATEDDLSGGIALASDDSSLTPQDAEIIADLDSLTAREETHLWTDDSTAF